MSNRPPDPKNARNKNVLVVGGSGSGKTRFFIKPNLLQCDSKNFPVSFVVTDPKGSIGVECGEALLKHGYNLKFFNTINFSKSMRYNPMAYIHSEKDVLKLVTALMTNTKGEGQGGDSFLGQGGAAFAGFTDRVPPLRSPCRGAKLRNIAGNAKHYAGFGR